MHSSIRTLIAAVTVVLSSAAFAQEETTTPAPSGPPVEAPSPEAVKNFWNFFYRGQGQGLVLADAKLCTEVAKEGDNKFECTKEVDGAGVKAGTSVLVWQAYLVPQNDSVEDLMVQLKQGGTVRETKDVKVKGESMRSRTWTSVRIPKPGDWTIVLLRGDKTLKELKLTATK